MLPPSKKSHLLNRMKQRDREGRNEDREVDSQQYKLLQVLINNLSHDTEQKTYKDNFLISFTHSCLMYYFIH